jgi:hypothetical protein
MQFYIYICKTNFFLRVHCTSNHRWEAYHRCVLYMANHTERLILQVTVQSSDFCYILFPVIFSFVPVMQGMGMTMYAHAHVHAILVTPHHL